MYDVWGTDENNIWVGGWFIIGDWGTNFMHYNGTEWEQDPFFAAHIRGIFGFNKNEIYAVGGDVLDDL